MHLEAMSDNEIRESAKRLVQNQYKECGLQAIEKYTQLPSDSDLEADLKKRAEEVKYAEEHVLLHSSLESYEKTAVMANALRDEAQRLIQADKCGQR